MSQEEPPEHDNMQAAAGKPSILWSSLQWLTGQAPKGSADLASLPVGIVNDDLSINILGQDDSTIESIDDSEWEIIWVTADSGAAVSMLRTDQATSYAVEPTPQSKSGFCYTSASNGKVAELGKRTPVCQLEHDAMVRMHFIR